LHRHWAFKLIVSLLYLPERQGEGRDTGLFEWKDITFTNITGTSSSNRIVWLDCAKSTPCNHIQFKDFNVKAGKSDAKEINYVCNNVALGGKDGLDMCHPSESSKEGWKERPHKGAHVAL
jgi:galacturan 1,4-alpha-galacturonidase